MWSSQSFRISSFSSAADIVAATAGVIWGGVATTVAPIKAAQKTA
jgi:hypothetical protein